ncbi:MAG: phosphatidylglycerophosphatase A [Burkholderiales bacterium]|nr:phosphatidylglycerophosphatase A [Burkholderiales bacterium]
MIVRPDAAFLFKHPAHLVALGFGAGLAPVAPGTFGTLVAFPIHTLCAIWLPPLAILGVAALLFAAGVWACGRTGRALGIADHSAMVWDEVVAFLAILACTPADPYWQVFAFVAFRAFDVLKPPPIRHVDRRWKGGFGVMFDDVLAGLYTLLVVLLAARVLPAAAQG